MTHAKAWLGSSIGKKQIIGLTGLGISFFALMHMSGNLLILFSAKAYNLYGHALVTNPFFPLLEGGLVAAFLVHISLTLLLAVENKNARPLGNSMAGGGAKKASFASRSMAYTGLLLLVFLVLHISTFKYGPHYTVVYDGVEVRDLHTLIMEKFQQPLYVGWYVFSLLVLALHLSHGASSVFQSLGLFSARSPLLRRAAWAFALVVAGGFISQPLWVLCGGAK